MEYGLSKLAKENTDGEKEKGGELDSENAAMSQSMGELGFS